MKKLLVLVYSLFTIHHSLTAQDLSYYLPKDIIYHEVGEYHVTHDRLVNNMKAIAATAPDRVRLETMGFTCERRPHAMRLLFIHFTTRITGRRISNKQAWAL